MKILLFLSSLAIFFVGNNLLADTSSYKFNSLCYLNRYPDVYKNWVSGGQSALSHWKLHGKKEGRIPHCQGLDPATLNRVYSNKVSIVGGGEYPIKLTVDNATFAGAVASLKWNKKEFINIRDHGRQLQSAIQIDGYVECNNPTEAGTEIDADGNRSTSRVRSVTMPYSNQIKTTSQMAYWVYDKSTGSCKKGIDPRVKSPLSPHFIKKDITIGFDGDDQIIKYIVTFKLDLDVVTQGIVYEFLTGYLNPQFNKYYFVNSFNRMLIEVPNSEFIKRTGQGLPDGTFVARPTGKDKFDPVILSNKKGSHAMGVYISKEAMDDCFTNFHGNNVYRFNLGGSGPHASGTNKWSLSLNESKTATCMMDGQRSFEVYIAVGTLDQVHEKLNYLIDNVP